MELLTKKELLLKAMGISERNVGKNMSLPVLSEVLLKTDKKHLKIISTDLELAIAVRIPAKIEKEGSCVINPKTLSGFLNSLSNGDVKLTKKKNSISVEQNKFKSTIKTQDDKEYPILPKVDKKKYITHTSQDVSKGLGQVVNSSAANDLKPELNGVLFTIGKNEIKLAATDSFRLSEKTLKRDSKENIANESFIVPAKAIQEIIKNYQDEKDILFFYIEKNQLTIQNEENEKFNVQVITKLVEGDYPDYTQIIPKEYTTKSVVSKKEFVQQIRAAGLFSSRINDIELKFQNKKIQIHSQNQDVGEFNSSVDAATEGDEQEVKFNHQYLLDGLNNIEGEEIIFKISKADGPTLLESTKNKDMFYILMPIRN